MGASNYVYITVEEIKAETQKAFLCVIDGEEYWIPFSQIADAEDFSEGDTDVELAISEWIATEKGIEW